MLSNLISNLSLSSNPVLTPVNSGAGTGQGAGVSGQSQSVPLSSTGTGYGGQAGFGETLNNSINNSGNNPVNNTAANQPLRNNAVNAGNNSVNSQVNAVPQGDNSSKNNNSDSSSGTHNDKSNNSKTGGANNSVSGSGGQAAYFIGNTGIISQPISLKKGNSKNGGSGTDKNAKYNKSDAASSSGAAAGTGKDGKTSSSDTANNAAAVLSLAGNTASALNLSQPQNYNNDINANGLKNIVKNGTAFKGSADGKNGNASGGSAGSTVNSANISGSQSSSSANDAALISQESGGQANNSPGSAGIKDGGKKNTGDGSQAQNTSNTKIGDTFQKTNLSAENTLKNIENQTSQNNINNINSIDSKNTGTLIKDAFANAMNLTALNGETKSVLSETDAKGSASGGGNVGNNAAGTHGNNKIIDFIEAGSSQVSAAGLGNPASNGNSAGFNLSGGNISGANDSAGETSGSLAVNSVMFMLKKNVQSATITLNPASLGTVKINIALNASGSALNQLNQSAASNGSITINMLAQNEAAKNILQSSSNSLHNALKNQGFSSINLNISTGSGYNNHTGDNGNETLKNPFIGNSYNGGSFANGPSGIGAVSSGLNIAAYRNPDALIDYFV
ncbi:MAG: flagellar hook-length control protein FliK [bacterium]